MFFGRDYAFQRATLSKGFVMIQTDPPHEALELI